jgi:mRNA interferase RelE/StbE
VKYQVEFKPRAVKDLKALSPEIRQRIVSKIEIMQEDLLGDVKMLTNFIPEYRLRVGNYRVLFEIEENRIVIYRIKHRSNAYK